MPVLVQQAGRIQVQRVTAGPAGQPFHAPAPQRTEGGQIFSGAGEALEEAGETGLTADTLNGQQLRQHHVATQMGDLGQLLRARQDAGQEAQRQVGHRDGLLALAHMRQDPGQQRAEAMPVEEPGKGEQPGPTADLLVGEADVDGLLWSFEFNEFGHCLVTGLSGVI
jgi:hypothetical protein